MNFVSNVLKRVAEAALTFNQKRALKAELLDALKRTPSPGGVDLPPFNHKRPNDPANRAALLCVQAVQEILKERPDLTVTRSRDKSCLCRRSDISIAGAGSGGDLVLRHLERNGTVLMPGDTFVGNEPGEPTTPKLIIPQ